MLRLEGGDPYSACAPAAQDMFRYATDFNQPVAAWDVGNQPVEAWDVGQVTNMGVRRRPLRGLGAA